jgi:hypothetical protein
MYIQESATAALRAVLTEPMEQWSTSWVRETVGLDPAFRAVPLSLLEVLGAHRESLEQWLSSVTSDQGVSQRTWDSDPRGYIAIGLDRLAGADAEVVVDANWFEVVFPPDTWGTIISHPAFPAVLASPPARQHPGRPLCAGVRPALAQSAPGWQVRICARAPVHRGSAGRIRMSTCSDGRIPTDRWSMWRNSLRTTGYRHPFFPTSAYA